MPESTKKTLLGMGPEGWRKTECTGPAECLGRSTACLLSGYLVVFGPTQSDLLTPTRAIGRFSSLDRGPSKLRL